MQFIHQEARIKDLHQWLDKLRSSNVISLKDLRSFTGKCSNFASLLYTWRPFLNELWAALHYDDQDASKAPKGCVWLKQGTHTLRWLEAFLEGQSGTIIRSFSICNYSGRGPHLRLITDACPWGMGGVFTVDMWIVGWFATQITA